MYLNLLYCIKNPIDVSFVAIFIQTFVNYLILTLACLSTYLPWKCTFARNLELAGVELLLSEILTKKMVGSQPQLQRNFGHKCGLILLQQDYRNMHRADSGHYRVTVQPKWQHNLGPILAQFLHHWSVVRIWVLFWFILWLRYLRFSEARFGSSWLNFLRLYFGLFWPRFGWKIWPNLPSGLSVNFGTGTIEDYTYLIGLLGKVHVKMWEVPHFARRWRQFVVWDTTCVLTF